MREEAKFELWQGDCLELMKNIPDGSVDLVLTDPPYGTMKGASIGPIGEKMEWDTAIDPIKIFKQISRILRPKGKAILFSQEPYTSRLITSAIPSLPFSYRAIWYKDSCGNPLIAKVAMVNRYEDICLFSKKTPKHYFGEPAVFNLWQGGKAKSNVLEYKKEHVSSKRYHPTQKPVALLEDLIQTYSNEGNTVLDFTMGSGSTGVACVNTNRRFIGIELDEGYFKIAEERINNARLNQQTGRKE